MTEIKSRAEMAEEFRTRGWDMYERDIADLLRRRDEIVIEALIETVMNHPYDIKYRGDMLRKIDALKDKLK